MRQARGSHLLSLARAGETPTLGARVDAATLTHKRNRVHPVRSNLTSSLFGRKLSEILQSTCTVRLAPFCFSAGGELCWAKRARAGLPP